MLEGYRKRILAFLIVLETVVLLYLSFQPSPPVAPRVFLRAGDLEHIIAYLVYGGMWALLLRDMDFKKRLLVAVVVGSALGVSSELIQGFVPGRVADPVDWLLDTGGAGIGGIIQKTVKRP